MILEYIRVSANKVANGVLLSKLDIVLKHCRTCDLARPSGVLFNTR